MLSYVILMSDYIITIINNNVILCYLMSKVFLNKTYNMNMLITTIKCCK